MDTKAISVNWSYNYATYYYVRICIGIYIHTHVEHDENLQRIFFFCLNKYVHNSKLVNRQHYNGRNLNIKHNYTKFE